MKPVSVGARRHARRPRRPRELSAAEREGFKRHQLLLPMALPHVERLLAQAKKRGYKPSIGFHPMEGGTLDAVRCRFCSEYFSPWARSEQRRHAAQHCRLPSSWRA